MSRQLFTVGPVHVEAETLQAMTKPMITHRCKEYKQLHGAIVEKLRKALQTDDDIFLVGGSATVMIEGAVRNGAYQVARLVLLRSKVNRNLPLKDEELREAKEILRGSYGH